MEAAQQNHTGRHGGRHVLGVELKHVLAVALGLVHRGVRVFQQFVDGLAVVGIQRDAHAGRDVKLISIHAVRFGKGLQDLVGQDDGVFPVPHIRDKEGEFVFAHAGQGVPGSNDTLQSAGNFHQKQVADTVARRVVDVLEMVQIEKHDGDPFLCPFRLQDGLVETVAVQNPIGQMREIVEVGKPVKVILTLPKRLFPRFDFREHFVEAVDQGPDFIFAGCSGSQGVILFP